MTPRYYHSSCCVAQEFVDRCGIYDVYVCFGTNTVTIRWGDDATSRRWVDTYLDEEGNTYRLCDWSRASFDELESAAKRAVVLGLITLAKQLKPRDTSAAVGNGDALERLA